jgi:hypothetical protein
MVDHQRVFLVVLLVAVMARNELALPESTTTIA